MSVRVFLIKRRGELASLLNLLMENEEDGEPIRPLEIEDRPRTGLPWIAFWLKELITWGTLDPVAAYLLARTGSVSIHLDGAGFAEFQRIKNIALEAHRIQRSIEDDLIVFSNRE